MHCMIHDKALGGKLYVSELRPASRRQKVLDVGCGTGIWVHEMAEAYPNLDVVGIDLVDERSSTKIQPNATVVYPVDFSLPEWPFPPREFDLIRNAHLNGSVPDWERHLRKCQQ